MSESIWLRSRNRCISLTTVLVMYAMIMRFRIRVENRNTQIDARTVYMYDNVLYRMYSMRRDYLQHHGATILDDTPFKEFVIPCVGAAMHALRINQLMQEVRFRKYHFRGFKYNPHKSTDLKIDDYKFLNTSGNIINGPRDRLFDPSSLGGTSTSKSKRDPVDPVDPVDAVGAAAVEDSGSDEF